ncbi:MAG: ABC transporter permease, partial [Gammaproteobacteria bacterium]|nr:ABC transporter permease [Gammaproteobacteria bacterium]
MKKVLWIALREFIATVCTKAFLLGLLFLPVMIVVVVFVIGAFSDDDFRASGTIAIVDPTGQVTAEARQILASGSQLADLAAAASEIGVEVDDVEQFAGMLDLAPDFTLMQLPRDADIEAEKAFLFRDDIAGGRLALVVIDADAIEPAEGSAEFGSYELYVGPNTDEREIGAIRFMLRDAIINLRVEAQGFERGLLERLTSIENVRSITVTEDVERATVGGLNFILPMAFMFLLFMGIMGGGQGLMTSTIEEKSSRVVEVLLSAVSPMQL